MNRNIEKELESIANEVKQLHDRLMMIHFSYSKTKQQSNRILNASGRLYEAYCRLKKKL